MHTRCSLALLILAFCSCTTERTRLIPEQHVSFASVKWCANASAESLRQATPGSNAVEALRLVPNEDQRLLMLVHADALYQVGLLGPSMAYKWRGMAVVEGRPVYLEDDGQVAEFLSKCIEKRKDVSLLDVVSVIELFGFFRGYGLMGPLPTTPGGLRPERRSLVVSRNGETWQVECDYYADQGLTRRHFSFTLSGGRLIYAPSEVTTFGGSQ